MRTVLPVSITLGIAWNVVAVYLMGGRLVDAFSSGWLLAGALAGIAAGLFTIWSRRRRKGTESFLYGIATYYLGIFVYWASFVIIQRAHHVRATRRLDRLRPPGPFEVHSHLHVLWNG